LNNDVDNFQRRMMLTLRLAHKYKDECLLVNSQ